MKRAYYHRVKRKLQVVNTVSSLLAPVGWATRKQRCDASIASIRLTADGFNVQLSNEDATHWYEVPAGDIQKSFYKKAYFTVGVAKTNPDMRLLISLRSYNTLVFSVELQRQQSTGNLYARWAVESVYESHYSATTMRHINGLMQWFGFRKFTAGEMKNRIRNDKVGWWTEWTPCYMF